MIELSSKRLRIISLSLVEFQLFVTDIQAMEKKLGLVAEGVNLEGEVKIAMEELLEMAQKDLSNLQWLTSWQIILITENRVIGSACFMGPPNEKGEVEIGYGINEPYRGHGYMTEAVIVLSNWALIQKDVNAVTAKTGKDNPSSWRVLEKAGLIKSGEDDEGHYTWTKWLNS
ncbi:TPA: N-acetyltransferase [Candidatus Dependentiae bacterium]|nr:N-acetyltransferase [Candidatus Dependentiae bacterium]